MDHLVDTTELGIVVLDVPGRQIADALDFDLVDHGVEDPLARGVLVADRHQDAIVLAVLVGLVAQTDRRGLPAAPELVGEHRRVEVEHSHGRQPNDPAPRSATMLGRPSRGRLGR